MPYHADTVDYLGRLATAGGSISDYNIDLLDTKIKLLYAENLRGSTNYLKYWLSLNITQTFTGCNVPIYDDGVGNAINHNFVASDWNSFFGLTSNGSTKYLDSNFALATQLGAFTTGGRSDFHISAWVSNFIDTSFAVLLGVQATNNINLSNDTYFYMDVGRDVIPTLASYNTGTNAQSGFLLGNIPSLGVARLLLNGALVDSKTGTPTTVTSTTDNLYFFADNYGGSPAVSCKNPISNFTIGYGLSTTQETALYNILALNIPYYSSPLMMLAC